LSAARGLEGLGWLDRLLVLAPALPSRIAYGLQLDGEPFFAKYLALGQEILAGGPETPFAFSPVYSAWMALLVGLFGVHVELFRWIQLGFGLLTVLLVASLTARTFGRPAGILAGLLYGCYGPALLYEGDLVTDSLDILFATASLWLLLAAARRDRGWLWAAAGGLLGLAAGTRPNALLLVPLCAAWALTLRRGTCPRPARAALVCLGAALAIAPITLLNHARSGEWILVTTSGGYVFYASNNPMATGLGYAPPEALSVLENRLLHHDPLASPQEERLYRFLAERAAGHSLGHAQVSALYFAEGWSFLARDPAASLRFWARKLTYLLNDYEALDTASLLRLEEIRRAALPPMIGFGSMLAAGLVGLALSVRLQPHAAGLLGIFLLPHLVTGAAFYVTGRLRAPMAPVLAVPAALAVAHTAAALWRGSWRGGIPLAAAAALAVLTHAESDVLRWHRDVQSRAFLHSMHGLKSLRDGDPRRALDELLKATRRDPLGAREAHANLALLYTALRLPGQAEAAERRAAGVWELEELERIEPRSAPERIQLGMARGLARWRAGHRDEATADFEEILRLEPRHPDAVYNLGVAALAQTPPQWEAALDGIERALALGMRFSLESAQAHRLRARCLEALGRPAEAAAALEIARHQDALDAAFERARAPGARP
jgi:4-amino-4-deoxy-L-arabinose transferase-like glycosyltransferase